MNNLVCNEIIQTNEVMPCPLCGQRVIVGHNTHYDKWIVECPTCLLKCGSWGNKDVMLKAWNKREKKTTLSKLDIDEQYEVSKQIEARIRAKAIDEYTSKLLGKCMSSEKDCQRCPFVGDWCQIVKIAEQLKKGEQE